MLKGMCRNKLGETYKVYDKDGHALIKYDNGKELLVSCTVSRFLDSYIAWSLEGKLIQHAFPYLTPSEREFIMTGLTDSEWDKLTDMGE